MSRIVSSLARKSLFACDASAKTLQISIPARTAGTTPNALRALNRPPTLGSALTTVNPAARVSISSGEPGSVTKMMCDVTSRPASATFA